MPSFLKTPRSRIKRLPKRGFYDRELIYSIIDEALICHVGFVVGRQPYVIPTIHARRGDTLLLHGAKTSRLITHAAAGHPLSVAITLLDGLVVARGVFHNSMNYRSVVLFGKGKLIEDPTEQWEALRDLTERVYPGRWDDSRLPNRKELKATAVVAIEIEEASAKMRSGPPVDDAEDYALPFWAGVLPVKQAILPPEDDPRLRAGIKPPDYIVHYTRKPRPTNGAAG